MSRPCFALSVMLCCMAGPLLVIGKTHAQDTVVSPSHDPGECIVCPLAHGPLEVCGGYSDYDYNQYWYDDYSPPTPEATTQAAPELEVAQSLTDGSTEEAWESGYEDYYADYDFGDDSTTTDVEDLTLEETPDSVAVIDVASEAVPVPDMPQAEETSELYDEYGWYNDDAATEDYFDSYGSYEPIDPAKPDTASVDEATAEEAPVDYEAYEEEWFSYGSETTVEAPEVMDPEADEAYEALSESASEAYSDEIIDAPPTHETWGDEEAWYREEYGYDGVFDEAIEEACPEVEPAEQLETGYDKAYDEAMATDLDAAEPVADILPANANAESPQADDYESFYDAYDDLYNFESTPAESFESETSEATVEPAVDEHVQQAMDAEPAWLTKLVDRMLAPIWRTADGIASNASILNRDSHAAIYVDECAQGWDCESDCWARSQAKQPSVVLSAADTLDGMAAVLQNAAEFLRGVASERLAETAQAKGGSPR